MKGTSNAGTNLRRAPRTLQKTIIHGLYMSVRTLFSLDTCQVFRSLLKYWVWRSRFPVDCVLDNKIAKVWPACGMAGLQESENSAAVMQHH